MRIYGVVVKEKALQGTRLKIKKEGLTDHCGNSSTR